VSKEAPKRQKSAPRTAEGENPSGADGKSVTPAAGRKPPPWEKDAGSDAGGGGFGIWLRRQREAREISLRDIAERTKIGIRYLEALEEERFDILPAPVFTKGFLREYASYVGLSADEAINNYLVALGGQETTGENEITRAKSRSSSGRWTFLFFIAATLLLLVLLALFSWRVEKRRQAPASLEERPPIAAPPPLQAPPPPQATPAAPQSAPLEINLEFSGDCWIERSVDGGNRTSEMRVEGESLRIEAKESVLLTLGNAGAVKIQVNGAPFPLAQGPGEIVRDLKIDLETVNKAR
jgi:cytoskeleton protein RodZ